MTTPIQKLLVLILGITALIEVTRPSKDMYSAPDDGVQSSQPPDLTRPWRQHRCIKEWPNMTVVVFSYCTLF